jgi:uncharacterized protein YkwD
MQNIIKIFLSVILTVSISYSQGNSDYAIKQKLLNYTNSIRAKGAVCAPPSAALKWNSNLERAANAHVVDMAKNNFLEHIGSGGVYDIAGNAIGKQSNFMDRIKYFGFPFVVGNLLGENIARVSTKYTKSNDVFINYKKAVKHWLEDPPHCKILMDKRFTDVGISYYKKNGIYYFVMDLGEIK